MDNLKTKREFKFNIFIYIVFCLIFFEIFLNFVTVKSFHATPMLINLIFIISLAFLIFAIAKLFKEKTSFFITSFILFIISFIYASQIVYYYVFKTYYTIYSVVNSKQVLEVKTTAISAIIDNILNLKLVILFIPFILFIFLRNKLNFKRNLKTASISLLLFITAHMAGLGAVYLTPRKSLSVFDYYVNAHDPSSTVENLGLLNYMRLDIKENLFGENPETIDNPIIEGENDEISEEKLDEINEDPSFNAIDIDFEELISREEDNDIKSIHKYFKDIEPTEKNEHTGRFKDYNLVLIVAESFSHLAIDKNLTPTLYKMKYEGYNFENFYTPIWGVSTSDGEYVANTSLLPKSGVWSFKESSDNNMYFAMGNSLKRLGYTTKAYHNNTYTFYHRDTSHPNMGYDYKGIGNGLDIKKTWPSSDLDMIEASLPEYIEEEKFHAYYMTVSGHMLYNFEDNHIASKNRHLVEGLDLSQPAKAYLAANIELDKALEYLIEELEKEGKAENTLIALSSDHYPYGLETETIEELQGESVDENFEIYRNDFLVYSKGMEAETIKKPASSLDIIPTLQNLLGLEYDSRLLIGRDIFSNSDPLVVFLNRSFISSKGRFNAETKEFIPSKEPVSDEYIEEMNNIIDAKFYYSEQVLDFDYYNKVFGK